MGKVRRLRQKYHLSLKASGSTDGVSTLPDTPVLPVVADKIPTLVNFSNEPNIFKGINISVADLKQTLLPSPKPNQVILGAEKDEKFSQQDAPGPYTIISKKDKRMARRAALLKKIDTVQRMKAEVKEKLKQKRKKEHMTGVGELIDALPVLPVLSVLPKQRKETPQKETVKEPEKKKKNKSTLPQKQRKKKFMEDLRVFKAILSNDSFKADPLSAVSNHVMNTVSRDS